MAQHGLGCGTLRRSNRPSEVIIDSSALVAVLAKERGYEPYSRALENNTDLRLSAGTYLEIGIVVDRHPNKLLSRAFDQLLVAAGISIVAVSESQARIARAAYRDFGRDSGHPAGLNFGDCFAYALAVERDEPLLFKGDDFLHTDVRSAVE
jgi:ribonuclease VapC